MQSTHHSAFPHPYSAGTTRIRVDEPEVRTTLRYVVSAHPLGLFGSALWIGTVEAGIARVLYVHWVPALPDPDHLFEADHARISTLLESPSLVCIAQVRGGDKKKTPPASWPYLVGADGEDALGGLAMKVTVRGYGPPAMEHALNPVEWDACYWDEARSWVALSPSERARLVGRGHPLSPA